MSEPANYRRLLLAALVGSVAGAALVAAAAAAVVPRFSLENLVDRSQAIVEGRVTRSWTAWDPEHKYLWTHYEIAVLDAIRNAGRTISVSEPGGSLDGVSQGFSGALSYATGEHVVLFLFRTPIGYWRTAGGGQGKFSVVAGRVSANTQGLEFAGAPGGRPTTAASKDTALDVVNRMDLAGFKLLVRRMAHERPLSPEVR